MEKKYSVDLVFAELLLLDGQCSEKVQQVIETAKAEQALGFDLPFMNEVILKSQKTGTLSWRVKGIRSCSFCDKTVSYQTYTRDSRHHRKGDLNYNKPRYHNGLAFNEGFVTVQGSGHICLECAEKHKVIDRLCAYVIDNDLKIELSNRKSQSKYIKDSIRICRSCKKEMQASLMGRSPTMMGGGTYPSTCYHCGTKDSLFDSHGSTGKFVMIPNPEFGTTQVP